MIFPNFQNCERCERTLKDNLHTSLHLACKYARIFALGHYLFSESSEQLTSTVGDLNGIFSDQMKAIVYIKTSSPKFTIRL